MVGACQTARSLTATASIHIVPVMSAFFAANRLRTVATVGFVFVFRLVWLFEI